MYGTRKCLIPIRKPDQDNSKFVRENYTTALRELLSIERLFYCGCAYTVSIELSDPSSEELSGWSAPGAAKKDQFEWVCISISIAVNAKTISSYMRAVLEELETEFEDQHVEHKEEDLEIWHSYVASDVIREGPQLLLICSNLAYPGVLQTGNWILNGEIIENFHNYLDMVPPGCEYRTQSLSSDLRMVQCYKWARDIKCDLEISTGTRVNNAFNAFTQFFARGRVYNYDASLMWAMMGIEALCVSSDSVQRDLKKRLPLLLGESSSDVLGETVSDRQINELYAARSRYIHGQIPIHSKWSNWALNVTKGKKKVRLDHYTRLAVFWLVSLLRELCRRNLADIEFIENTEMKEIKCGPKVADRPN